AMRLVRAVHPAAIFGAAIEHAVRGAGYARDRIGTIRASFETRDHSVWPLAAARLRPGELIDSAATGILRCRTDEASSPSRAIECTVLIHRQLTVCPVTGGGSSCEAVDHLKSRSESRNWH